MTWQCPDGDPQCAMCVRMRAAYAWTIARSRRERRRMLWQYWGRLALVVGTGLAWLLWLYRA